MADRIARRLWAVAAADPALVQRCPLAEQLGFGVVGGGVVVQCGLVGGGAAEALLLASHGDLGPAGPPLFLLIGVVLAIFWASVVRLSLVNMGGRIAAPPAPPTAPAARVRALFARQLPNLARLAFYGALGVVLSLASLVPLFRFFRMLAPDDRSGVLTLARAVLAAGMPAHLMLLLLLVLFVLPVALRAYAPMLARGRYEQLHQEQLRAVVLREGDAALAVWSAHMRAHGLDPVTQRKLQQLDAQLLVPPAA